MSTDAAGNKQRLPHDLQISFWLDDAVHAVSTRIMLLRAFQQDRLVLN